MRTLPFKPYVFYVAAVALSLASCSKNAVDKAPPPTDGQLNNLTKAAVVPDKDGHALSQLLKSKAPQFTTYSISGRQGGKVQTQTGTIYSFSPNIFALPDGSPATGTVNVSIKEIKDVAGMILSDKPTVTRSGEQLISYGEFFVNATQSGVPLRIRKDSAIRVSVPARNVSKEIPMWSGDSTVVADVSGYNYINQYITVAIPVAINKGLDWSPITNPGTAYALFDGTNGTLNFRLDSLLRWRNCDIFNGNPNPRTTVIGYFDIYNPATSTSYGGEEPSMLFFKPKGLTSLVKFYSPIFQPPAGYEGFVSAQNGFPITQSGTFLAITAIGGKFYAEQRDVIIPAPAPGNNYVTFSFNLKEVTASDLMSLILSMNSK